MSDQINAYLSEIGDFASEKLEDSEKHSKPFQTLGTLTASGMAISAAAKTAKAAITKLKNIGKPAADAKAADANTADANTADAGAVDANAVDAVDAGAVDAVDTGAVGADVVDTIGLGAIRAASNISETSFGADAFTYEPYISDPGTMGGGISAEIPASESLMARLIATGQARASQATSQVASQGQELDQLAPLREMMGNRGINFQPEEAVEEENVADGGGSDLSDLAGSAVGQIRSMTTGVLSETENSIGAAVGNVADTVGNTANSIGGVVGNVADTVGNTLNSVGDTVVSGVSNAVKTISGAVPGALDTGFFGAEGILDAIPGLGELAAPVLALASIGVGLGELFDPAPIPAGPQLQADE